MGSEWPQPAREHAPWSTSSDRPRRSSSVPGSSMGWGGRGARGGGSSVFARFRRRTQTASDPSVEHRFLRAVCALPAPCAAPWGARISRTETAGGGGAGQRPRAGERRRPAEGMRAHLRPAARCTTASRLTVLMRRRAPLRMLCRSCCGAPLVRGVTSLCGYSFCAVVCLAVSLFVIAFSCSMEHRRALCACVLCVRMRGP